MRPASLHLVVAFSFLLLTVGGAAAQPAPATQPWQPELIRLTKTLDDLAQHDVALLQGPLYDPANGHTIRLVYTNASETAYLGVGVESPGDTLRAQLVLPAGAGLVVNYVDEKGPANGPVNKHDVLQKLDDQILVNAEQLITLIRMHKPGDSVSLTLIREATPQAVRVKLGAKQDDGMHVGFVPYALQDLGANLTWTSPQATPPATQPAGVPVLKDIPLINKFFVTPLASGELKNRPITFNDGDLLACLDGAGNLLAIDVKTGSIVFHGPITTEEQWRNAPPILREKLSAWKALIAPPNQGGDPGPSGTK